MNTLVMPYSSEAEAAVLGSCMVDKDALSLVMESVTTDDFYLEDHRTVFNTISSLARASRDVDMVSVSQAIGFENKSVSLPSQMVADVGFGHIHPNLKGWVGIIKSKGAIRRMISICQSGLARSQDADADAQEIINDLALELGRIETGGETGLRHVHDIYTDIANVLHDNQINPKFVLGISSGYEDLDSKTLGFKPKRLTICAARPGVGKTAFACNLIHNAGIVGDAAIAFFSLEMDAESVGSRIIACNSDVKISNIQGRWVRDHEWSRFLGVGPTFKRSQIWIDDSSRMTPQKIRSRCLRMKREVGRLDMVVVDYIGLMKGTRRQKRNEEIGEYSYELKALAKDLNCHVFCLAQLNRDTEGRAKPLLSNLKESGDLEQDADLVIFIHPNTEESYEFIIAKNRHGYRGSTFLRWIPGRTKFENQDS